MVAAAADAYEGKEAALKLRTLNLLYESIRKSGGTRAFIPKLTEALLRGT